MVVVKTTTDVLNVQHITKTFGDFKAVDDASFAVQKGEIFGFLGPNGAGKTTTIRVILDILRPTSGRVVLFGNEKLRSHEAKARIGYLSGDMALDDDITGQQYLEYVQSLYGGGHEVRLRELAHLLQADLSKKIGSYSRGNRQKIGLIAALVHEPELLILDEPTSGFDPLVQETFMQLVREYRDRGGTVFMSSHILSEVQQLCDKVAFIKDGRLSGVKTLEELEATTAKQVRVVWANEKAAKTPHKLPGLELIDHKHLTATYRYNGEAQALLTHFAKLPLSDITIREPDLDELFMSYYQRSDT